MSGVENTGEISAKGDHEVEWKIKDILSYTAEDKCYYSPTFTISDTEWFLSIYPNGQTRHNSVGWIDLYLYGVRISQQLPKGVHFTVGVKRADGTVNDTVQTAVSWSFDQDDYGIGFSKLLQLRYSDLPPSSVSTLTCTLNFIKSFDITSTHELSRNLSDLFTSKKGCDATLEVKSKKFPVHRSILSARSPVFAAMFEADMKEKETGVVSIPDCDPEAFEDFLAYLYSGTVDLSRNASKLFEIADKYDVEELKRHCSLSIMESLSVENVLDVFILGHRYSDRGIQCKAKKFFSENFSKIILTERWKSFMVTECLLANELLQAVALRREL